MKIYEGRPDHNEGRLEKELAVYDLLDELEIAYERVDHETLQTIEACREVDETLGISICKNLFLCNRQRTSYYLLLLPGHNHYIFSRSDTSCPAGVPATPPTPVSRRVTSILSPTSFMASIT